MQRSTLNSTMLRTMKSQKESEMQRRLRSNPMDAEANAYFGDKIRKQNVEAQYRQMMEEFPESMGRVLMLYIDAKVNDHPIQAFVDSGAQASK
jgi:DNA damage-inducible protein 1